MLIKCNPNNGNQFEAFFTFGNVMIDWSLVLSFLGKESTLKGFILVGTTYFKKC